MTFESILITGSSGMIGTALVERLLEEGYNVTGVDITSNLWSDEVDAVTETVDLREKSDLERFPTEVDAPVHLGAHARVHRLVEQPKLAMENMAMMFNLLEFARSNGVSNFLFASSREVYGNTGRSFTTSRRRTLTPAKVRTRRAKSAVSPWSPRIISATA